MKTRITVEELYALPRDQPVDIPILCDILPLLRSSPGITVTEISARLGLKRKPLSYIVKIHTGLPLETVLKQWRLMQVKQRLNDPHLSYESVANHCGFSSVQAMSKFLDRMIHLTAYEYREGRSNGHRKK